jgi:tripartite-type tricarboxylate transporter receptor subunit TctC
MHQVRSVTFAMQCVPFASIEWCAEPKENAMAKGPWIKIAPPASFTTALFSAVLITCAFSVSAQQFPTRPVRMIVPFVAGGGADLTARRLAEQLSAVWKQPVVIQNIGGAGGNLAVSATASSEPTGYTVLFASLAVIANNPALYDKLPFDPDKDLAPVILLAEVPLVLIVSATLPAADVSSFIALARKQPGTLHFGSGGVGTSMHLAGELLKSVAGIDLVHVPFKGANQVIAAIMGNEIQFIFQNASLA